MKNWTIQGLRYDFSPTPLNYIRSRQSHYQFCKKADPTLTADLYLDNLSNEIIHEIAKHTTVNKKSLTLLLFKRILSDNRQKEELTGLFAQENLTKEEITSFLQSLPTSNKQTEENKNSNQNYQQIINPEFPVRTYIIATHIYLELNNNELHYESLIRDTSAMQEFIKSKFRANHLSKRLSDMKNFNYKSLSKIKNNSSVKGQLKPQFKQISSNPQIFGNDVSAFATKVLAEYLDI